MSKSDPTDHALAAIASILDQQATPTEPKAKVEPKIEPKIEPKPNASTPTEAEGYSKVGPGPIDAVRFKWTVRRENEDYYVDETIGENSRPLVSDPLTKEDAIRLVDDRESDARLRFDLLKQEMNGQRVHSPKSSLLS